METVTPDVSGGNVTSTTPTRSLERSVIAAIDLYLPPFLIVSGTVCNVLVIMVMQTPFFNRVSTSLYMAIGSCLDTASLLVALPAHWIYVNFPWSVVRGPDSHYMCKFFAFFGWSTSDLGIILTVAMTAERAVAVTFPLHAFRLCTRKRAKVMAVLLLGVVSLKNCHLLIKSVVVPENVTTHLCDLDLSPAAYTFFWVYVWPWVHNLFLLLSFLLIVVCNCIIHCNVTRSGSLIKKGDGTRNTTTSGKAKAAGKTRQLTVMLAVDSLCIVACTLPFSIMSSVLADYIFPADPEVRPLRDLLFVISFYLLYLNRCANFYLYCLSGSRFRRALQTVLRCRVDGRRGSKPKPQVWVCPCPDGVTRQVTTEGMVSFTDEEVSSTTQVTRL